MTLWKMNKINIHSMNNPFGRMCFQGLPPLRWKLCSTLSSTVSTSNKRSEIIWASSDSTLKQIFEADFCLFESTFAAANQFSKDARNSFLFFTKSFFPPQKIGNDLILTMTSIFGLFSLAGKRCFLNWKNHLLSFISSFYSPSVLFSFEYIRILGSLSTETFWIHLHPPLTKFLIFVWHFLSSFFSSCCFNWIVIPWLTERPMSLTFQRSAFQKKIPTRHFFSRQNFFGGRF